jgi:hypothetical protein
MSLIEYGGERHMNPVDVVERVAAVNEWTFERAGDDEITISVTGRWTDYQVAFTWMDEIEALHVACAFDLKVPERRRAEVLALISQVNEQLWLGHFDLWSQDGVVMFRHALVLAGGVQASSRQCEVLLDAAIDACERYYQAFQFVVWAGTSAREAMDAAVFETSGEA